MDAPDLGLCDDRGVGPLGGQEPLDGGLAREVELGAGPEEELDPGLPAEASDERRAHHALVACDEELGHGRGSFAIWDSRLARSKSWSTMILTSSLKRTFGLQPSCFWALDGSPI